MHYLSHQSVIHQLHQLNALVFLRKYRGSRFMELHFDYLVADGVEAAAREDEAMSSLWVPAYHFINELIRVVEYLELLVYFCIAAAVENSSLANLADKLLLIFDLHCGSIFTTQAPIALSNPLVRRMLVVIKTSDAPRPVRRRHQNPLHQVALLLERQVNVPDLLIVFVSGYQLVLIGQIAGHKGESDGGRYRKGVVAVFQRIVFLYEKEMPIILQFAPVKHHCKLQPYQYQYQMGIIDRRQCEQQNNTGYRSLGFIYLKIN